MGRGQKKPRKLVKSLNLRSTSSTSSDDAGDFLSCQMTRFTFSEHCHGISRPPKVKFERSRLVSGERPVMAKISHIKSLSDLEGILKSNSARLVVRSVLASCAEFALSNPFSETFRSSISMVCEADVTAFNIKCTD